MHIKNCAKRYIAFALALALVFSFVPTGVRATSDEDHKELALQATEEGNVLLKNEDAVLPFASSDKIAIFGDAQCYTGKRNSDDELINWLIGSNHSGTVYLDYTPQGPLDAFLSAAQSGRLSGVYAPLAEAYQADANYVPTEQMYQDAAAYANKAVMILSRYATEGLDMEPEDFELTAAETAMMQQLSALFEDVVVVLNVPSMFGTSWSLEGQVEGIDIEGLIVSYYGGEMSAQALVNIMLGDTNPSGKLTHTFAMDLNSYYSTETYLESPNFVRYTDDIYVGYRYFETFAPDAVAYEFGFGLSYTTFDIETNSISFENGNVTVNATVTNTGDVAGKEVVQVYFSAPQAGTGSAKLSKAARELAAYEKTELLQPGQSQQLTLTYSIADMASFDDTGITGHKSAYVMEAGSYGVYVGNSVRNTQLAGNHNVIATTVTEQLTSLCPTNLDERLVYDATAENKMGTEVLCGELVFDVAANAATVIEAEDFDFIHVNIDEAEDTVRVCPKQYPAMHFYDGTQWNNTGLGTCVQLHTLSNGDLSYKIKVATAGNYKLAFSFAEAATSLRNTTTQDLVSAYTLVDGVKTEASFCVDVENTLNPFLVAGGQKTGMSRYSNFKYTDADTDGATFDIYLPAGEYELFLHFSEGVEPTLLKMDKFWIIPESVEFDAAQAMNDYTTVDMPAQDLDFDADNYSGILYSNVVSGENTLDEFLDQMSLNELLDFCGGHTAGLEKGTGTIGVTSDTTAIKYGIYSADTADGPAGIRVKTHFSTYWPSATMQAATWNTPLIEEIGTKVGEEARQSEVDVWLAPALNIHRNPLCGRNYEYYSEDPLISGKCAAAVVRGVEGMGVATVAKHFAANNKEYSRNTCDSRLSERALREIYVEGFRILCEENAPAGIMTSYNFLNGYETAESTDLTRGILRGEWGYEGTVFTDWGNATEIELEMLAGTNIKMPSASSDSIRAALTYGVIDRDDLEESVSYVLKMLENTPDYTVHRTLVHELSATEEVRFQIADYSRKSSHTMFSMDATRRSLYIQDAQTTDADGNMMFLEYQVDAPVAGYYVLGMNYLYDGTDTDNAFKVYVNGEEALGLNTAVADTGSAFVDQNIGAILLPEGQSTIRIQHLIDTNVGYAQFYLTKQADYDLEGKCPHCGEVLTEIQWETISSAPYTVSAGGHYRISTNIRTGSSNGVIVVNTEEAVVVDMNGKQIKTRARFINHSSVSDLYVIDSAGGAEIITANYNSTTSKVSDALTGCWFETKGNMRIYGGSWKVDSDVVAGSSSNPRMIVVRDGNLSIYGGTFNASGMSSAGSMMGTYGTTENTITIKGGVFIEGNGGNTGNAWKVNANSTMNIEGGTFKGQVYVVSGATVNISGAPVMSNLDLTDGSVVTLGALTEGASIGVKAVKGTAFTAPFDDETLALAAAAYIDAGEGNAVYVTGDNTLALEDACPHCGVGMSQIQWTDISSATYNITTGGHYRFSKAIKARGTNGIIVVDTQDAAVVDLNGKKIETRYRFINHNSESDLYVIDSVGGAEVISSDINGYAVLETLTGCWFTTVGNMYVYGGNWKTTASTTGSSTTSPRMITVNEGTLRIYGGIFDASTMTSKCGMMGSYVETANTIEIYGGTFIGGDGADLGNTWRVNAASTMNIYGGNFNGQVYVVSGADVNISGAPVMTELDLTAGGTVTLSDLSTDASITVYGNEGAVTNALASDAAAQAYLDAGTFTSGNDLQLKVEEAKLVLFDGGSAMISAIGLRTHSNGMYYYANYQCSDAVKEKVTSYGIKYELYTADGATKLNTTDLYAEVSNAEKALVTDTDIAIGSINNIIGDEEILNPATQVAFTQSERGQLKIVATPFIRLSTGDVTYGSSVSYSMKDCCEAVDAMITELKAGDAEDVATAETYTAYMENLLNTVWAAYDLTDWTFTNFEVIRETQQA